MSSQDEQPGSHKWLAQAGRCTHMLLVTEGGVGGVDFVDDALDVALGGEQESIRRRVQLGVVAPALALE